MSHAAVSLAVKNHLLGFFKLLLTCLQLTRKKKNACGLDPLASGHLLGQPVSPLRFFPPLLPSPFLLSFLLSCLPLVMLFTGFLF